MARIRRKRAGDNRGMTLLEVLAASALLAVFVSMSLQMFVTHNRITAQNMLTINRMEGIRGVQDEFRAAVREAVGVADGVLDYRTTPELLVLRLPPDEAGAERHAILGTLLREDRLSMMRVLGSNPPSVEYLTSLPLPVSGVDIRVEGTTSERQLVRLSFELKREAGEREPDNAIRYQAVATLRGRSEDTP